MTWQADLMRLAMRRVVQPAIARARPPTRLRQQMRRVARWAFRAPPLTLCLAVEGGLWVTNRPRGEAVVLYFHGGAYLMGAPETHAAMLAELAARSGARAFLPRYRLAPEHPFPAAFDDALAAWEGLLAQGHRADRIVLGGDSAGGGLALALLSHLCIRGQPPAGVFVLSPWTDLTLSGASLVTNARREHLVPAHRLTEIRALILGGARPNDADDPRLSPLHAAFPNPPPVLIHVAESEILRDDSLRLRNRLPDSDIRVAGDLPHVWPILHNYLPEARATLAQTAAFITACLGPEDRG